jgi:hypothetical protein
VVFYCRLQVQRNYELVVLISPFGRRTLKRSPLVALAVAGTKKEISD